MGALRMTGVEPLPGQHERHYWDQEQERAAQHPVSEAPVVVADQILGERDEDDGADAGGREGDADRGREPFAEPARDQRGARHHARQADADPDHAADEEIELPEVGESRRQKEGAAHAGEARGVDPARPDPVEDQADQRRSEAVHQQVDRIDAGELRAGPAVFALERQEEDDIGIAQPAPEHIEREARSEHCDPGIADQIFSAGSRPNTCRR